MSDKIPRFTLAKINAPLVTGLDHDKRLRFAHDSHGKSVLILSVQKNDMAKCAPMGWDDNRISDWGFEIPVDLLDVQASPNEERKKIQQVFGETITFSQAKSALEGLSIMYTDRTEGVESTLYVPRWACLATYDINGTLQSTQAYAPAKPAKLSLIHI